MNRMTTAEPPVSAASPHSGCAAAAVHDRSVPEADLLSPLTLRGVTLKNRIVMSPMCQYCAEDGLADDWHLVHLGSRAAGGIGLVMAEATAVTRDGRITPGCLGIWDDRHVEPLARVTRFIDRMGAVPAIQLAHAGRKAGCDVPWRGGKRLPVERGGWDVVGPSAVPFHDGDPPPAELDEAGIDAMLGAFVAAAGRALRAGFRVLELHAAHGYLFHSFLSPLSNRRTDRYGGSLENRMRLLLRVAGEVRAAVPAETPLLVRISATDWVDGGWDVEQSVALARALCDRGVDLIDVSSGGTAPQAAIPVGKGYQVPLAAAVRRGAGVPTGAVGIITEPGQANEVVTSGAADLVFVGRELLRNPYWALGAEQELGQDPAWPVQYGYAVMRRKPA